MSQELKWCWREVASDRRFFLSFSVAVASEAHGLAICPLPALTYILNERRASAWRPNFCSHANKIR